MNKTIALCMALLMFFAFSTNDQASATPLIPSSTPNPTHASSVFGHDIYVYFDQSLSVNESGYEKVTILDPAHFTLTTPNVEVVWASASGNSVHLLLSKSIYEEADVRLGIAGGAVHTSGTENGNAAISNFIVETPGSTLSLKNTLDPSKVGLTIEHIVPYLSAANPLNVYGEAAFNKADVKYLLSLVEGWKVNKAYLGTMIEIGEQILSDTNTENHPVDARIAFSTAISIAQAVYNNASSTQRQIDAAAIALIHAETIFSNYEIDMNVSNHEELLNALDSSGDIIVDNVDGFTGTLERVGSGISQFHRSTDGTRAFVAYDDQFLGALADTEVTNIYLAQDIVIDDELAFPSRSIVLSGPSAPKSELQANSIINLLTGSSTAIDIINEAVPTVLYSSWGLGQTGVLMYRGSDQAITIQFSAELDEAAQLIVNQALQDSVTVAEATYFDFDWYYADSVELRNNGYDPIYFESEIYAVLSDLPYAPSVKLLDPTPFVADLDGFGDAITSIEVKFSEPIATETLLLDAQELIESFDYVVYEDLDEDEYYDYTYYPIDFTSIEWDTTTCPGNPVLMISFPTRSLSNENTLELVFKYGVVKNQYGDVINSVLYEPSW